MLRVRVSQIFQSQRIILRVHYISENLESVDDEIRRSFNQPIMGRQTLRSIDRAVSAGWKLKRAMKY